MVRQQLSRTANASCALETIRLLLRPMRVDDFGALYEIFADPKVMASFGGELFTREQMQGWLNRNLAHQAEYGYGLFSVIRKSDGLLIGDCGLEQMIVAGQPAAELGYDFRSDAWRQGFATEAASAARLRLHGLAAVAVGQPDPGGQLASKRVAEKVGMSERAEIDRYGIRYWQFTVENPAR